jgi:hypothetical protein
MAPILGIYASQISGHLFAPSGAYDSIATTTVGSPVSSITFSSIPSTYTHLQIRGIGRTDRAAVTDNLKITLNSDTGSNYYIAHYLLGDGSTAIAGAEGSGAYAVAYRLTGSTAAASIFGTVITDVLDYTSTNKAKTIRALGGQDRNGAGEIFFSSALYNPLTIAGITSITLAPLLGTNFAEYSSFALFGIKGGN